MKTYIDQCTINDINVYNRTCSLQINFPLDANIEEYFSESFQNGYNKYSLYRLMYIKCNINTKKFTNDLIYEAYNYGNTKAVMWLLTIGEEVKNKFELLKLCSLENLLFYSQLIDIDQELGYSLILDKIKNYGKEAEITFLLSLHKYDFSKNMNDVYKKFKKDNPIYQTIMSSLPSNNLPVATMVENNEFIPVVNAIEITHETQTNSMWQEVTTYFNEQGLRRRSIINL